MLQVLLLRRWQRQLEEGGRSCASPGRPWFVRWQPRQVLAAVVLAVIGCALWPLVQHVGGAQWASGARIDFTVLWQAIGPLPAIASCVVWLWWLDQAPGNRWASRTAFPSWVLWQSLRYVVMALIPNLILYIALAGSSIEPHEFKTVLVLGTLPGGAFTCYAAMLTQSWRSVLANGSREAGTALILGFVAWGLYATVRHVRRRGMPQEELDFPWVR